jgi:hypothetical protein
LNSQSTWADLRQSYPVRASDGATVGWSATSNVPWLRVLRASGTTGIDNLLLELQPEALDPQIFVQYPTPALTLQLDRPGSPSRVIPLNLGIGLPRFGLVVPSTVFTDSARVRIGLASSGRVFDPIFDNLTVAGATVDTSASGRSRGVFTSSSDITVDLAGMVPGRPVVISAGGVLRTTQVQVLVKAPVPLETAFAPLPFGKYRPPSIDRATGAIYFAGEAEVWVWQAGLRGAVPTRRTVPGLVDVALSPLRSELIGAAGSSLFVIDGQTLEPRRVGALRPETSQNADVWSGLVDSAVPAGLSTLRLHAEGLAYMSLLLNNTEPQGPVNGHTVAYVAGCTGADQRDLTLGPACWFIEPQDRPIWSSAANPGTGMVQSMDANTVVATNSLGRSFIKDFLFGSWAAGPALAAGEFIVGLDNNAQRVVSSEGRLILGDFNVSHSLAARVSTTGRVPGGYALSADGKKAYVYSYKLRDQTAGQQASEAALLVYDLSSGSLPEGVQPSLTVDLPSPVGCTGPLIAGELCAHRAHVFLVPGEQAAVVLGPRGVATVALPPATAGVAKQLRQPNSKRLGPPINLNARP